MYPPNPPCLYTLGSIQTIPQVSQEELDLFDAMNLNIESYKASLGVKGAWTRLPHLRLFIRMGVRMHSTTPPPNPTNPTNPHTYRQPYTNPLSEPRHNNRADLHFRPGGTGGPLAAADAQHQPGTGGRPICCTDTPDRACPDGRSTHTNHTKPGGLLEPHRLVLDPPQGRHGQGLRPHRAPTEPRAVRCGLIACLVCMHTLVIEIDGDAINRPTEPTQTMPNANRTEPNQLIRHTYRRIVELIRAHLKHEFGKRRSPNDLFIEVKKVKPVACW